MLHDLTHEENQLTVEISTQSHNGWLKGRSAAYEPGSANV
ncbi:hypothetical protein MA3A0930S_0783 [Mycobacteroides abscessus 3A-0930-S]|nr:hypothetical protein MA6G0125S_1197 [Mycobacteroides abscessus 6G-0125-S]EIU57062.1 hypothetical protein MA6G0728S_2095 [Mycobacteroides abscessus 6G-0728-S]EIV57133.1 hypothetical protein MA3A0930S_0783 [Mycobacteroides abscessus 3A-0930-S]